jgi:hypothetical protein
MFSETRQWESYAIQAKITLPRDFTRPGGGICKCEALKAPHLKCVGDCPVPFCSIPTSVDLYCENRPNVPFRPVQSPTVVPCRGPFR